MTRLAIAIAVLVSSAFSAHARDWKATEQIKHYSVSGTTGPALYQSIGENGPDFGGGRRAIAHTTWDLKWRRDYQPRGSSCVLASAKPFVTIIYTLPKAKSKLSGTTAANWKVFSDGIAVHERVHGDLIRTMVDTIIAETVGLTVENDPGCKAIRDIVLERVAAAFEDYKVKSGAFDRIEMSDGGNVHRLILGLVNGG